MTALPATPDAAATSVSTKSAILPKTPPRQLGPVEPHKVPNGKGGFFTERSKECLGVETDRTIVWPFPNFSAEDIGILQAFCKSQETNTIDLLTSVAMEWFEANRVEITKHADGFTRVALNAEAIQKKIAASNRQILTLQAQLEKQLALETALAEEIAKEKAADAEADKQAGK